MSFNPFNKPILDLNATDLLDIKNREVTEGWFIEYKSSLPDDIGRHICAFANSHGGWIILGAKEQDKKKVISGFPGIDLSLLEETLQTVSNAASHQNNPAIQYREKILKGPLPEIHLPENKFVLIIEIPEGKIPPYIFHTGLAFFRSNDESRPIKERGQLDLLYKKSEISNSDLTNFIERNTPTLTEHGENGDHAPPSLRIFFISNPYFEKITPTEDTLSFEDFKAICSGEDPKISKSTYAKMDNFYASRNGFIARQIHTNEFSQNLPTYRWWHGGNFELKIQFNHSTTASDLSGENYRYIDEFRRIAGKEAKFNSRFIDITKIFSVISCSYVAMKRMLEITNDSSPIYIVSLVDNIYKAIPYIDEENYINNIRENGPPIIQDKSIRIPSRINIPDLPQIDPFFSDPEESILPEFILELAPIFFHLSTAMGVAASPEDHSKIQSLYGINPDHLRNTG